MTDIRVNFAFTRYLGEDGEMRLLSGLYGATTVAFGL